MPEGTDLGANVRYDEAGETPGPEGATSYDELAARLRTLRVWAGMPYRELHRRVVRSRRANGVAELPAYNTVYRCLQPGRTRMDVELVCDIATALLGDAARAEPWRQACRVIEDRASGGAIVAVTEGLPGDLATFVGRDAELAHLEESVLTGGTVAVVEGMAGVGKTATAVRLAHGLVATGRFPHVCLSVNLRGYDPELPPADPAAVLDGFLRALGLPGSQVATMDLARRAAAFRERLAGRRALVLLDNAASAEQVRPLLPDNPACLTLITSRRTLPGIACTRLRLDVFTPEESVGLLRRELGEARVATDPDSAAAITVLVGHLPLAVSLLAARVKSSPEWTLLDHLERLTERHAYLRLDTRVGRVVDLSYGDLGTEPRRLLRLAALHPGRDFDGWAAAALAGIGREAAEAALGELVAANLLLERSGGRFELHDLVRVFAADRARDEDPARVRHLALLRLFDHYRRLAGTAASLYAPQAAGRLPAVPDPGTPRPELPDRAAALAWLEAERPNLIAVARYADTHGWPEHTGHLSLILFRYLDAACHLDDAVALHTLASRSVNGRIRLRALGNLGATELHLGRFTEALGLFQLAADGARAEGDPATLGLTLRNSGTAHYLLGHNQEALQAYQESLDLARESGERTVETSALIHIGSVYERLGRPDDAIAYLRHGLELATEIGHRLAEATAQNQFGVVHVGLGHHELALQHHERALAIVRQDGMREPESQVLTDMGPALRALGLHDRAIAHYRSALTVTCEVGDRYGEACAHDGLARCLAELGEVDDARTHWRAALDLHTEFRTPEAADIEARLRLLPPADSPQRRPLIESDRKPRPTTPRP